MDPAATAAAWGQSQKALRQPLNSPSSLLLRVPHDAPRPFAGQRGEATGTPRFHSRPQRAVPLAQPRSAAAPGAQRRARPAGGSCGSLRAPAPRPPGGACHTAPPPGAGRARAPHGEASDAVARAEGRAGGLRAPVRPGRAAVPQPVSLTRHHRPAPKSFLRTVCVAELAANKLIFCLCW